VAVYLEGGPTPSDVASSIVDLTVDPPVLLREGALSLAQLREVVVGLGSAAG
jgi:tRNA A37 threonylcarbamoyladenosine synthetase subunit TsaC/SUA5/YrdC